MGEKVENYLYLQFKEHLRRVNLNKLEEQKESPEFELVADFLEEKLPYGMCVFLQDSNKLYMVGGERIRKNERAGRYWWQGFPVAANEFDPYGLTCDVFVLDSSNGKISAAPGFPKPTGPKINARALATMGDKVYVMSFRPYYYHGTVPSPAFECYDSAKQSWEELPVPPNYYCSSSAATTYGFHFVLGPKIYLCTPHGFFCYNVDQSPPKWEFIEDAEWQFDQLPSYNSEEEMEDNKIEDYSLPLIPALPYRSICFAEPGKGGLAVGYTAQGLVGYFLAPNGDLLYQEPLNQLNSNSKLPSPDNYFFGGKICYVGENKFCLILSGEIDQTSWSLAVATFDVKWKADVQNDGDGGGKHFYHDLPLCYHQFDNINSYFSNACEYENNEFPRLYDYLNFQDAFVMHSLEELMLSSVLLKSVLKYSTTIDASKERIVQIGRIPEKNAAVEKINCEKVGIPELLNGVGNGVEAHVAKIESEIGDFQKLLITCSLILKKLGIPIKQRKLILKYTHKYRLGLWRPLAQPMKS